MPDPRPIESLPDHEKLSLLSLSRFPPGLPGTSLASRPGRVETLPLHEQLSLLSLSRFGPGLPVGGTPTPGASSDTASNSETISYRVPPSHFQNSILWGESRRNKIGYSRLTAMLESDWFLELYADFKEVCDAVAWHRTLEASERVASADLKDRCLQHLKRRTVPRKEHVCSSGDAGLAMVRFHVYFIGGWPLLYQRQDYDLGWAVRLPFEECFRAAACTWKWLVAVDERQDTIPHELQVGRRKSLQGRLYALKRAAIPRGLSVFTSPDPILSVNQEEFRPFHRALLQSWGHGGGHVGTCVILTSSMTGLFLHPPDLDRYALRSTYERLVAQISTTIWARAAYATTVRRLVSQKGLSLELGEGSAVRKPNYYQAVGRGETPYDLDKAKEDRLWFSIHASHLCHEDGSLCIVHVVDEDPQTNTHRQRCHREAQILREQGCKIPASCAKHEPPCLLQLAALTTAERFAIQANLLNEAKGAPIQEFPPPANHPFEVFIQTRAQAAKILAPPGQPNPFEAQAYKLGPGGAPPAGAGGHQ